MKKLLLWMALPLLCAGCKSVAPGSATNLTALMNNYWETRMRLFPIEATGYGDNRYNDRMTITIAESFRDSCKRFYQNYADSLRVVDTTKLNAEDAVSYRLLRYELAMDLEGLKFPTHLAPINQFWAFTLELPQMGSGTGNQPFKTVKDYDNWLARMSVFPAWTDTAIANMRKGLSAGWVLPEALTVKIVPQLTGVLSKEDTASIFYGPIRTLPDSFPAADKARLTAAYQKLVGEVVNPNYRKLADFFKNEYLPKSRKSTGIGAIPGGPAYYDYCIRYWTTTNLSPDSIYKLGLSEVNRMESEMMKVKEKVGFKGSLQEFFKYLDKDPKFCPFKKPQDVLDSFWAIKKAEEPVLKQLFTDTPKTPFTIRQTEAFRAASASAEYSQGSADGTRPGIFYVPILDATKYNATGMVTLFLHEAIPGHHYQISIQQENQKLPAFRRFLWYGAYGEGWAHYSETLGTEMGLYNDPYQYFGHLSDGILRAIRLVVDVAMHTGKMNREEAIQYMMTHQLISEHDAVSEVERYMAIPGQALSYKIGQVTLLSERAKYQKLLGDKFSMAAFHHTVLANGCLPLQVLSGQLAEWGKKK
jgi:uncharacterized protein (DUF885 family)